MRSLVLSLALLCAAPGVAAADDLIHSDLPLWTDVRDQSVWPRQLGGREIVCGAPLKFGTWRHIEEGERRPRWARLGLSGAIHCYLLVGWSGERGDLKNGGRPSFLIALGPAEERDGPVELWALQQGGSPGSDYRLLARRPAEGLIAAFDVLQVECPAEKVRETQSIDIVLTGYCAINTQADLIALARAMAKLPPAGRLEYAGPE